MNFSGLMERFHKGIHRPLFRYVNEHSIYPTSPKSNHMLTLILLRHADAETCFADEDHNRKLTSKGRAQAASVGKIIKGWGVAPEMFFSSDATRALTTSSIVAREISFDPKEVVTAPFLYDSYTTQDMLSYISRKADNMNGRVAECVIIVAHNPDVTFRADTLLKEGLQVAFPTAGALAILFDADKWDDVSARSGSILRSSFL